MHRKTERSKRPWPRGLIALALAALAAAALIHLVGARIWPFELVHHFIPQYLLASAGLAVLALLLRARRHAAAAVGLASLFAAIWLLAPIDPLDGRSDNAWLLRTVASAAASPGVAASRDGSAEHRSFTLITHNVYVLNERSDELLAWLASRPADVVALQEVNGPLSERLRQGDGGYPYRLIGQDPYISINGWLTRESIVILSRFPIVEHRFLRPWMNAWQAVLVRLEMPDGSRPWLVAVHPPSPLFAEQLPIRDAIFDRLAEAIAGLEGPVIVAGDFNASPFTPAFRGFVEATGLATSRSFPATYSQSLGPFGIPIDHVLVRGARLADLRAFAPIGSDHRPLAATIVLGDGGEAANR